MPLPPGLRAHRLASNHNERSPYDTLFLDTESIWAAAGPDELHTLRLWAACHVRRRTGRGWCERSEEAWGISTEQLCDFIERSCVATHPLHCYAHNLSFDLALTRLPLELMRRGWVLGQQCLASDAPWANLQKGSKSLWLLDSHSWLPAPLEEIGRRIGLAKPALPEDDDSMEAWLERCRADVAITRLAMLEVMDWWDSERLGHWSRTGPQTGWNCLRHMCCASNSEAYRRGRGRLDDGVLDLHPGRVEISDEPSVRAFERRALYQGLREVTRVGHLAPGVWANLDLRQAHLRIAATRLLPCRLVDQGEALPLDSRYLASRIYDVIAEVEVECSEPRWPVRMGGHVLHPAGRFRTVLCGPEIRRAMERGELRSVGRYQAYALNHFSQPWARWLLEILEAPQGEVPEAVRIACKGWSRTVIGKWAARTSRSTEIGRTPEWGWSVAPPVASPERTVPALVQVGDRLYDVHQDQEGDNAFPAVLAFVQSWVRLQLLDAVDAVGPEHVVQLNTDGMIVDAVAAGMAPAATPGVDRLPPATWSGVDSCCAMLSEQLEGAEIALKGLYTRVWIGSPQHLELDGWRRMAGIPGRVERREGMRFEFLTWPKLGGQMRRGSERGYLRRRRAVDLGRLPVARWVTTDGRALPPVAWIDGEGGNRLRWSEVVWRGDEPVALAAEQAPFLDALTGPP